MASQHILAYSLAKIAIMPINMTMTNLTGDEEQKIGEQELSSSGLVAGLHGHLTFISISNSFSSLAAFLGNTLIVVFLHK